MRIPFELGRTGVLLVALASCGGDEAPPPDKSAREGTLELATELLEDEEIRAQLPFLAEHALDLALNVPSERIGDASLAELMREAAELGIRVRAWLVVPEERGYWANEHNLADVRAAAEAFDDWRKAEGIPVDWLLLDMETGYQRYLEIREAASSEAYALLVAAGMDPDAFAEAKRGYAQLVEDLHARGLKVAVTTFPQLLEDPADCDTDMEDGYDIPLTGIAWDEVNFMVYRSGFAETFDKYFGPDLVQTYADLAYAQYGSSASVSLGIIGAAGVLSVEYPYRSADDLTADRAAARAAGIEHVAVFALDTLKDQSAPADWVLPVVEAQRFEVTPEVEEVRNSLRSLDMFLGAGTCGE